MKTAITITVRMKSTRLPMKALKEFSGKTLIEHLIERLKRAKLPNEIILCTSTNPQDDVLIEVAKKNNIKYFRGDEDDVLKRLWEAARKYNIDFIVATTGDNPLTDPEYIDKTVKKFQETNADYITSLDLPWGTFSYGVKVKALKRVLELKKESDTEVWGQYFAKSNLFETKKVKVDKILKEAKIRLTIDTPEDFEFVTKIYKKLYHKNPSFNLYDVIKLLNKQRELKKINKKIVQKISSPINTNSLIDFTKAIKISRDVIWECFEQMDSKHELSFVFSKNPKIIFVNLPAEFRGKDEIHENEDDLYIVIDGMAKLVIEKNNLEITKGDIIHIPAKKNHKIDNTNKGIKYLVIKINKT